MGLLNRTTLEEESKCCWKTTGGLNCLNNDYNTHFFTWAGGYCYAMDVNSFSFVFQDDYFCCIVGLLLLRNSTYTLQHTQTQSAFCSSCKTMLCFKNTLRLLVLVLLVDGAAAYACTIKQRRTVMWPVSNTKFFEHTMTIEIR